MRPRPRTSTRLGRPFWLVWSASTVSSLGDGVRYVAFPLLAASLSHDPRAVAAVSVAGYLPWPLFGLLGGAMADRTDRRRLMWQTDVFRAALVTGCALAALTASASIALLAAVAFLLGVADTFFENAASAILPMLVAEPAIERANSWLLSTQTVMSTLVGAPLGGALFVVAESVPLVADAVSFALAAALVALVAGSFHPRVGGGPTTFRQDIAEGLRWLLAHRLLRTMALLLAVINGTFAAAESVLVLYSLEVLRLPAYGYGVLLAFVAIGGLFGALLAGGLHRLLGLRWLLVGIGLSQAGGLLVVGLTSSRLLMVLAMLLLGAVSMVWNVVTVSLRQRLVPPALLGRVTSSYRVIGIGVMPVGAALAGIVAHSYGLHMPYLAGGLLLATATLCCLPLLGEPEPINHGEPEPINAGEPEQTNPGE